MLHSYSATFLANPKKQVLYHVFGYHIFLYFWSYFTYASRKGAKRMSLQHLDHSRKQVKRYKQKKTFINNTAIVHMCTHETSFLSRIQRINKRLFFSAHRLKFKDCFRWCDERPVETQTHTPYWRRPRVSCPVFESGSVCHVRMIMSEMCMWRETPEQCTVVWRRVSRPRLYLLLIRWRSDPGAPPL